MSTIGGIVYSFLTLGLGFMLGVLRMSMLSLGEPNRIALSRVEHASVDPQTATLRTADESIVLVAQRLPPGWLAILVVAMPGDKGSCAVAHNTTAPDGCRETFRKLADDPTWSKS